LAFVALAGAFTALAALGEVRCAGGGAALGGGSATGGGGGGGW